MAETKHAHGYTYIDEGQGTPLVLLHGLFGALSNWDGVVNHFSANYRVIIPVMPLYELPLEEANVESLARFIGGFLDYLNLDKVSLLGNSLGGHVGIVYTLHNPQRVTRLVLTGSSGLFEDGMGGSYPKRGSYEYVKERVEYTFFDPQTATKALIDEVFEITKSIPKCLRIVAIARDAQRTNVAESLHNLNLPVLLVWGLNDTITPTRVAYEFNKLIKGSELYFIDKCCHAPMMEHPEKFNAIMERFLLKTDTLVA